MIIVFEGPDGAGKSTIAKAVAESLGYNYRGRITRVGPDKVIEANRDDLLREGNWVLDRCYWISDFIYEPLNTGNCSIVATTERSAYDLPGVIYVYVDCKPDVIRSRIGVRGDDLFTVEQILAAAKRYDAFFKQCALRTVYVENSFNAIDYVIAKTTEKIKAVIEREEKRCK